MPALSRTGGPAPAKCGASVSKNLESGPDRFAIPCHQTVPEVQGLILPAGVDANLAAVPSDLRTAAPESRLDRAERTEIDTGLAAVLSPGAATRRFRTPPDLDFARFFIDS